MTAAVSPPVARLVATVTAGCQKGSCWVLMRPLQGVAVIASTECGPVFAGVFRRANLADATGLGLLAVGGDLVEVPLYDGGGRQWAWHPGVTGSTVEIPGGGR